MTDARLRRILENTFERIGHKYHTAAEEMYDVRAEWEEAAALWRLCGFGEPLPFAPTLRLVKAS